MKKTAQYTITGTIELKSGTRIGGSDDVLQIGGTDLTCIKNPATGKPYLPGSSLKGRMRSGLERVLDKFTPGKKNNELEPCGCAKPDCVVCLLFGPHKKTEHSLGPSRILVSDAQLLDKTDFALENKSENIINRANNAAQHPRVVERVAPGAVFALKIGLQVFDADTRFTFEDDAGKQLSGEQALLEAVYACLGELQLAGIGSGNSKGYGSIEVRVDKTERVESGKARVRPAVTA